MRKKRFALALLSVLAAGSVPASALADPLSTLRADSVALAGMAQTWTQIQSAAQSYGQLAPYAGDIWAGPGPVVTNSMGFREQCHNTHWDQVTQYLVTGALNIGGDGEAEAYAIQAVATDFPQQLSDYIVQLVQSGNPQEGALANQIMAQKGPLLASLNDLTTLLNTTSSQLSNATGPNSSLQPLPISHWQAGIGDVPNLAQVQYIPGPSDGAPIGWYDGIAPTSVLARLVDICPTGTASLPTLPLKSTVMQGVQQALVDEPSLGQVVHPLESGSTWFLPSAFQGIGGYQAFNPVRSQLVSALATDETGIAGYMAPINAPLEQYNQDVQRIMEMINANESGSGQ